MYTIVTFLNCAVSITKQNENILSLQGVISKNRPSPLENWDVSHACTQMYNFWGSIYSGYIRSKESTLNELSEYATQEEKKFLYVELLTIESLAPNAPKNDHDDQNDQTSSSTIITITTKFCWEYHWDTLSLPSYLNNPNDNNINGQ